VLEVCRASATDTVEGGSSNLHQVSRQGQDHRSKKAYLSCSWVVFFD